MSSNMLQSSPASANEQFSFALKHPSRVLMFGPTGSGKTHLICEILKDPLSIEPAPTHISWFFGAHYFPYSSIAEEVKRSRNIEISFNKGIDSLSLDSLDPNARHLIIIEDLMTQCRDSPLIEELFYHGSSHQSISVIATFNNIFTRGKSSRTIQLNSNIFILFRCRADVRQVSHLFQEFEPERWRFLLEAFNMETQFMRHGWLLCDFSDTTPEWLRYRNFIGNNKVGRIYVHKDDLPALSFPIYISKN